MKFLFCPSLAGSEEEFFMNEEFEQTYKTVNQDYNLIGEIVAAKYIHNFSIEIGYAYATKKYNYEFNGTPHSFWNSTVSIKYHIIPVQFNAKLYSTRVDFIYPTK